MELIPNSTIVKGEYDIIGVKVLFKQPGPNSAHARETELSIWRTLFSDLNKLLNKD